MKLILSVLLAVILPMAAFGQAKDEELFSWTPSVSVYPKYLFGNGFVAYDGTVVQTRHAITYKPWGLSIIYFESFASKPGFGREKDLSGEKAFSAGGYYVVLGFGCFVLHDNNEILQPYADVSRSFKFDKLTVTGSARLEMPFVTPRTKFEGGNIFHLSVNASYQITDRLAISGLVGGVYDDGVGGFNAGVIAKAKGEVNYKISKHFSAFLNATYTNPLTANDARYPVVVPGFGLRGSFEW